MIVDDFQGKRVLVVGDVMLDHFVRGSVARVSPEAPTLVLNANEDSWAVGGAGNVARNVANLGGDAYVVGLVGEDRAAGDIAELLGQAERLESRLLVDPGWLTIEKTRFIAGDNHLLRVDRENCYVSPDVEARLVAKVQLVLQQGCDAIIISDYAKGVVTPTLIAAVAAAGAKAGIPIVADPKRPNFEDYRGCTVLTPNRKELSAATRLPAYDDPTIEAAIPLALEQFGGPIILTRSEQGISLFQTGEEPVHEPARNRGLRDVSGAGDTVAATVALCLATGASLRETALTANAAAGIAVSKSGTSVVTASELLAEMLHSTDIRTLENKLATVPAARRIREVWRQEGLRVGFTNGCFDIIHPGHITLLQKARARCEKLVVALNTDASVQRLKGLLRPVQLEAARAEIVGALEMVDMVLLFDEDTPLEMIKALTPDVLFKGSDYTVETVVGHEVVQSYGGKVELIDLVQGYSTTRIIERSRAAV